MCVCPLCVLGVGWVGGSPVLLLWGGKRVEACMGSGHAVFTWIENTHAYTLHPMFSNINNTLLVIFVPYYIYGDQNGRAGGKDRHNLGNEN